MSDENKFDSQKFGDDLRDRIHQEVNERLGERMNRRRRGPIVVGIHIGNRSFSHGLLWGSILILVGLAFLLDHMGYLSIERIWRFWPLALVVAGVANVFNREQRMWGLLLFLAGAFLQLNMLGITHFGWGDFLPLILIAAGVMVLWNSLAGRKVANPSGPEACDPRTTVNGAAIFSGLERRVTTQDFQGGSVTAIFGGVELDLTEAEMKAEEATLELNTIFGGAEVRVPDTWLVSYRGAPIFGGVEDKTRIRRTQDGADAQRKVLNITGAVIFGGLEIKN